MSYVKDQWTRPVKQDDGTTVHERTKRWGRGKVAIQLVAA